MTTLQNGATTLTLSDDMLWQNEHAWQAVVQRRRYTITGALIVEASTKQTGRDIVLAGGADYGWVTRATLATLYAWCAIPALVMTLTLRGVARQVVFDQEGVAIDASPVWEVSDPDAADPYVVTLRFIEV